jgi:hypothetical protein
MTTAITRLAAIHRESVNAATWEAFLADVPMSWLPLEN